MEDKILVNLGTDHTWECAIDIIGREGEGNATRLELTIPEKLIGCSVYLDFEKPNGEKLRTPKLGIENGKAVYDVVQYLLTDDGDLKVQAVLITDDGKIWKSTVKKYITQNSINAVEEIPDKEDFFLRAQQVFDELSGEIAEIADALANDEGFAEAVAKSFDAYVGEKMAVLNEDIAKKLQLKPESANDISECTDISKLYVVPDKETGIPYIYAYMYTERPAYHNAIEDAVDVDGTPYNGGLGYKEGRYYSTSAQAEAENAGSFVTGYIPVPIGATIRFKNITLNTSGGKGTITFFNASKGLIPGTFYTNGTYGNDWFDDNGIYAISPTETTGLSRSDLAYFRISCNGIDNSTIITVNEEINDDDVTKDYAWVNTGHAFVPADYEDRIIELEADAVRLVTQIETLDDNIKALAEDIEKRTADETPEVILPSKLYGVVGHEFVLYYDNILRCMIPEDFIVSTVFADSSDGILSLAPQFDRMLKFTPTSSHIGTHNITIKVINRRTWETVATKDASLIISAETSVTGKKVLFIGDSLTEASIYPAEIERMTNKGITSIGTIKKNISFNGGTAQVNSEGRSGWGSYDYMNDYKGNGFTNPFYNPNQSYSLTLDKKYYDLYRLTYDNSGNVTVITHNFDFAYYIANAGVGVPDAVFINLGTNGGTLYAIESVYVAFDAMIERIRAYSSTIPIFLYLFPPTSRMGNSSRNSNGVRNVNINRDTRCGYYDCIKKLIDRYENDTRVIIVPTYTMLDTLYDFKTETVAVSARNEEQVTIGQSDSTHPAKAGYLHMADSFYNALQYLWR